MGWLLALLNFLLTRKFVVRWAFLANWFASFLKLRKKWESYLLKKLAEVYSPAASLSLFLLLGFNNLVYWNLVYTSKIHFLSDIRAEISDLIALSGPLLRVKYFWLRVSYIYIKSHRVSLRNFVCCLHCCLLDSATPNHRGRGTLKCALGDLQYCFAINTWLL
jgi:hypothetical protein